jgi:hypothetical protein
MNVTARIHSDTYLLYPDSEVYGFDGFYALRTEMRIGAFSKKGIIPKLSPKATLINGLFNVQ